MRILKALLLPLLLILTLIGVDKLHGARPVLVGPAPQALLPRE
ncbi:MULTISPECIES: hypothetical protein [Pseudomonas]|uniref:DsbE family thiol:disulfide interchange protein n=1 Tax=Pseudomonas wuhanensis TaxID=2954098 RepID=A0ABY9GJU5_9PSED|nr:MULTISPECIES: hypothetical protein [unclassified Pseudomonas]WLI10228.1 hypothetical protein PSH65_18295 [Pseudomonas sp. FP603]WLI16035.1 hypothetical protein PSH88_16920 [Pseudomonas sp. FP607]